MQQFARLHFSCRQGHRGDRFARLRSYPWNLIRLIPAKGARRGRRSRRPSSLPFFTRGSLHDDRHAAGVRPPAESSYGDAFPHSTKVYVEGSRGIRVPMREIALSGGEPPLRVYDSSGPQGMRRAGGAAVGAGGVDCGRGRWRTGGPAVRRQYAKSSELSLHDGAVRLSAVTACPPPPPSALSAADLHHPAPLRPPRRDHPGDGVRRHPRGDGSRARAERGGARARHHPRQHQPPRARADDHRPRGSG